MHVTTPHRVSHTYTQRLIGEPSAVFPLLCPVREADWLDGWDPISVITRSGVAEPDCVFVTPATPNDAIWYVTQHDPQRGFVEMLKITPLVTACRLTIQLRPIATGSEATVTYTHTSLGPEGDAFVAAFTAEDDERFMQDWEARVNHYLATGTALRAADTAPPAEPGRDAKT